MKTKLALVFAVLLAVFAGPAAHAAEPEKASAASGQTVLVYNTSGGFAPATVSLIVYSNGSSVLSCTRGGSDKISRTAASAAQIQTLQKALLAAGALTLPDSLAGNPDVAIKTVTFFKPRKGSGQTPSSTFSYRGAKGSYGTVQSAIDAFLTSVFPPC